MGIRPKSPNSCSAAKAAQLSAVSVPHSADIHGGKMCRLASRKLFCQQDKTRTGAEHREARQDSGTQRLHKLQFRSSFPITVLSPPGNMRPSMDSSRSLFWRSSKVGDPSQDRTCSCSEGPVRPEFQCGSLAALRHEQGDLLFVDAHHGLPRSSESSASSAASLWFEFTMAAARFSDFRLKMPGSPRIRPLHPTASSARRLPAWLRRPQRKLTHRKLSVFCVPDQTSS